MEDTSHSPGDSLSADKKLKNQNNSEILDSLSHHSYSNGFAEEGTPHLVQAENNNFETKNNGNHQSVEDGVEVTEENTFGENEILIDLNEGEERNDFNGGLAEEEQNNFKYLAELSEGGSEKKHKNESLSVSFLEKDQIAVEDHQVAKPASEEITSDLSDRKELKESVGLQSELEVESKVELNDSTMSSRRQNHERHAEMADMLLNERPTKVTGGEGIGQDIQHLIQNMNAAGFGIGDHRISPKTSPGYKVSGSSTTPKKTSAAVAQKKGAINIKTPEPKRQDLKARVSTSSRKVETGRGSCEPAKTPATTRVRAVSSSTETKSANAKLEGANKDPVSKTRVASRTSASPRVKNLFETSPLAAGVSPELTKLAKSTPSHLIRPTSSVYRSTTSSKAKTLSTSTAVGGSKSSPTQPIKASKSSVGPIRTNSKIASNNLPTEKMGDADGGSGDKGSLKDQFAVFSRFGDSTSDGKQITLSNCDKWMKQAHVIDGKKITTTDTSILFKKLFKTAKKVGYDDFKKYTEELATTKKLEPKDVLEKLTNCGAPGHSSATKAAHTGVVERLTDTSKYTGSHKERFDSAGKGRGIEGRRNVQDDSGYVAAFKDKKEEEKRKSDSSSSPTPPK